MRTLLFFLVLTLGMVAVAQPPYTLNDAQQFKALQAQVTDLQNQVNGLKNNNDAVAYICANFLTVQTTVATPNPCSP